MSIKKTKPDSKHWAWLCVMCAVVMLFAYCVSNSSSGEYTVYIQNQLKNVNKTMNGDFKSSIPANYNHNKVLSLRTE